MQPVMVRAGAALLDTWLSLDAMYGRLGRQGCSLQPGFPFARQQLAEVHLHQLDPCRNNLPHSEISDCSI